MKKLFLLLIVSLVFISVKAQSLSINKDTNSYNCQSSILFKNNLNQIAKLNFPNANFLAIYNNSIANYNYYPSGFKNNFNLYSPRITNQLNVPIKMDSFNPYATNKPQIALLLGAIDLFLRK